MPDVRLSQYSQGFLENLNQIKSGVLEDKHGWIYKVLD